jgi:hypothetical protein
MFPIPDDSSRFAYRSFVAHVFATSGNAYDACQTDAALVRGTLLLIPTEAIVALADTWPIAVTAAHGALHQVAPDRFSTVSELAAAFGLPANSFADAAGLARDLGFALDPALAELLG